MIVAGSTNPLLLAAGGYNLTRSLRFRSSASAYLSRTPASAGNRQTWTWSAWVKRGTLGTDQYIFTAHPSSETAIRFTSANVIEFYAYSGGYQFQLITSQVFRDPSAWYHIVAVLDTTNGTSSNRAKLYVNGTQVTAFSTATYPSSSASYDINNTTAHSLGSYINSASVFYDGYLTEINFIDGQALTPSSFGETSSTTGVWQPKKYAGTYGTNGFYLPFTDNSALTSGSNAGLGKDFSGNGNYWNTNNISITSGSTYDSMTDVPTLTSATASNFATLNPVFDPNYFAATNQSNVTMSGGNLNYGSGGRNGFSTIAPSSGKYYWEMSNTTNTSASVVVTGIVTVDSRSNIYGIYYNSSNGNKGQGLMASGATETAYGATWTDNDIIGVALDCDNNTVTFYKNNASQGAITNANIAGKQIMAWMQSGNNVNTMTGWFNFGQRPFAYTPPTGYVALNTYNLPTPTIGATASSQANKYFDVLTWTGNGSNPRNITGLGFQPDMVWEKSRSTAYRNRLQNAVVGANKLLFSDNTDAEQTNETNGYLSSFNSDGFTVTAGATSDDAVNNLNDTYVAWNWKANGTGGSNTAGSITSTVSANTTSGFSIVTYTGTGANATVGHGLGVAPKMIIFKQRSASGNNWLTYHSSLGAGNAVCLNLTLASFSTTAFQSTSPTSSVFSIGTPADVNANTSTYVAYCFAEVAGFSKFGSYTGNGSSDGPFIYTGFRPAMIWTKPSSDVGAWNVLDNKRGPYNVNQPYLQQNSSNAEATVDYVDFLSNGFKIRYNGATPNGSGQTIIYIAFAENPFKYSLAR